MRVRVRDTAPPGLLAAPRAVTDAKDVLCYLPPDPILVAPVTGFSKPVLRPSL